MVDGNMSAKSQLKSDDPYMKRLSIVNTHSKHTEIIFGFTEDVRAW